jgi:hypothetical protein
MVEVAPAIEVGDDAQSSRAAMRAGELAPLVFVRGDAALGLGLGVGCGVALRGGGGGGVLL